ncbi:MAG: ATP-binding protein [Armatimonadota bacterium]
MHNTLLRSEIGENLDAIWATQWHTCIAQATDQVSPDLPGRLHHFTRLLWCDALAERSNPLQILHAAEEAVDPAYTSLPVETTQQLGLQALAGVLAEVTSSADEALAWWQALTLPWLYHPYFAISSMQDLATVTDQGSLLTALIGALQASLPPGAFHVWRIIHDDSPIIEVTQYGTGRSVKPGERPDLCEVIRQRYPQVTSDGVIIPVRAGETPFAAIELNVPAEILAATMLHVLALVRTTEQALAQTGRQGQTTNPATWQRVLTQLARVCTVTHSAQTILTAAAEQLRQALPCERITYWESLPHSGEFILRSVSARLTTHSLTVGDRCPAAETPLHVAWHTGQPLLLSDGWSVRFPDYPDAQGSINAIAIIPLVFEYRTLGVLTVERLERRPFTRQDADWLMLVAGILASALRNVEIHEALRKAQEMREQDTKMRALGEMAAGITHDFNNILMSLMCNVELLGLSRDQQQMIERLPHLERAILDARTIVERVSTFGRTGTESSFVQVALAALLRDSVEFHHPQLTVHNVTVETFYDPDVWIEANPAEIREVIANLLTNALQAMPEGGRLTVACGQSEDHAWFSMRDTGVGMSPAVLARACDPFFSTKGGMGTGLGLSVSYSIIRRHSGLLRLESEEGAGTTVCVDLPACEAPPPAAENQPSAHGGRRILLVEDHQEIADMLGELLRYLGYHPTIARTVAEGIARCENEYFNLILTDLVVQGETGDAIAQTAHHCQPETPVLLLSGSLDLEGDNADIFDGILRKPITLDKLREAIQQAMVTDPHQTPKR